MLEEKTKGLVANADALLPLLVTNALNMLGALVILLIGLWLSGKADRLIVGMLSRTPHFDEMLKGFFGSRARCLVLTVTRARGAVAIRRPDDEPSGYPRRCRPGDRSPCRARSLTWRPASCC